MRNELVKTDDMWYVTNHCRMGGPGNQRGSVHIYILHVYIHTYTYRWIYTCFFLLDWQWFFVHLVFCCVVAAVVIVLGKIDYALLFISSQFTIIF